MMFSSAHGRNAKKPGYRVSADRQSVLFKRIIFVLEIDMTQLVHPLERSVTAIRLGAAIGSLARFVLLALRIRRERNQLADLSDDRLRDIGISRTDANREAARDLFDIPARRG